jgi:hypothetical protein
MIYLITFSITGFLGFLASRSVGSRRWLLGAIALLPLCTLAGFRATTVGTDVEVYAAPIFEAARNVPLSDFLQSPLGGITEPIYTIFTWAIANSFQNLHWYLFFLQLVVVLPLLVTLIREFPTHIGSGLFVYSCITFGFSLNIMRQSIAASILILAFFALLHKKKLLFVLWIAVATGFHNTGILGLGFIPLLYLFGQQHEVRKHTVTRTNWWRPLVAFLSIALIISSFVFSPAILTWLSAYKASYAAQVEHVGQGSPNESAMLQFVLAAVVYFLASRHVRPQLDSHLKPLLAGVGIAVIGTQYSIISPELGRIGMMFLVFLALFYPAALARLGDDRNRKAFVYTVMLVASLFYFVWVYVKGGSGEIYPYSSPVLSS